MSPSNEQELADIRRTLTMLAERVVRLERKIMGRTLMEVFTEEDEEGQEHQYSNDCECYRCWNYLE